MPDEYDSWNVSDYFSDIYSRSGDNPWLNWIPQNGNYGGNAANDAWIKAQAWVDVFGDRHTITRDANGANEVRSIIGDYTARHSGQYDDPLNMKILGPGDQNAVDHDLVTGGALDHVIGDLAYGINQLRDFVFGDHGLYEILSAPFIAIGASAEAIIAGAAGAAIEIGQGIYDAGAAFFGGFATAFGDMAIGDFGGAIGAIFDGIGTAITDFFSSCWNAIEGVFPVVVDLAGTGVNLTSLTDGHTFIDTDHVQHQKTGWVGAGSGILAYDANHNGSVDGYGEFGLTHFKSGSHSDLEGLSAFDANHDGVLNKLDPEWNSFLIWQDVNGNGVCDPGEAKSLNDLGISAIGVDLNGAQSVVAGNLVLNTSRVTFMDGSVHQVDDVSFASSNLVADVNFLNAHTKVVTQSGMAVVMMDETDAALSVRAGDLPTGVSRVSVSAGAGHDVIEVAAPMAAILTGGSGYSEFFGNDAGDLFKAGSGTSVFHGGRGADTFVVDSKSGDVSILGFKGHGEADRLEFSHTAIHNFDDFLSHSQQVGSDVYVSLDPTHHVLIANMQLSSLHAADLLLV